MVPGLWAFSYERGTPVERERKRETWTGGEREEEGEREGESERSG